MILLKKLKFRLIITPLLLSINVVAQEGAPIKDVGILEEQKKVLVQDYPHHFEKVNITNVEQFSPKHSKVYYTKEGVNYEAVVNSDRKDLLLVATAREIPIAELPAIVKDALKASENGSSPIKKAFIVSTPYSSGFYRIDINQNAKETKSVYYDKLGQYQKPPY